MPITLSKEDYDVLLKLEEDIRQAQYELERAKRVGLDVSEFERQLNEAIELRRKILEEYKPEL
ncbi:MAG: hypothetical protein QXG12_06490 [Thermoproteota archaeon]